MPILNTFNTVPRYLADQITSDLDQKMVMVAGPRQVGKTTLAKSLPGASEGYLNWDVLEHRGRILEQNLPDTDLWVFDEIHKYRDWRNWLKGLCDSAPISQKILVTGSGRLDLYRFGGDSLQGRYHFIRMYPLTFAELNLQTLDDLNTLLTLGGFPEPWLTGSETEAKRWSSQYRSRIVQEDAATLESIRDLGRAETTLIALPDKVGSPLSINSLRKLLQVSHKTLSSWLDAFERFYAIFRLHPFTNLHSRSIRKESKHYHFDWSVVPDQAAKFENLVACHLLKWVHWRQDAYGEDLALHFYRDRDGREVDFVITDLGHPSMLVECKISDADVGRGLKYLAGKFENAEAWQISATGHKHYRTASGIRVSPATELLSRLI